MKYPVWTCLLFIAGCASVQVQSAHPVHIARAGRWAVLPFANNTETPLANERAAFTAAALLQVDGETLVGNLPHASRAQQLLGGDWRQRYRKAMVAARNSGALYGLAGSVDEWGYRAGINAQPVVGLTLWVIDLRDNKVVWSGVASGSGGHFSGDGTSTLGQTLIRRLLDRALGR